MVKKFFSKVSIFLIVVFVFYIGFFIPAQREREERIAYESELHSEGYHEGYEDGYEDAFDAVKDRANGIISWASSYAGDAYRELEAIYDEFYIDDELHDRLSLLALTLEEIQGMELDLWGIKHP